MVIIVSHAIVAAFLYRQDPERFHGGNSHASSATEDGVVKDVETQLQEVTLKLLTCCDYGELGSVFRDAVRIQLSQSRGSMLLFIDESSPGKYFLADERGTREFTEPPQCVMDAYSGQQMVLVDAARVGSDTLAQMQENKVNPVPDNSPVACSPVFDSSGTSVIAVLTVLLDKYTQSLPDKISLLQKQITACYNHIQRTFQPNQRHREERATQAIIKLCGELYDQDASHLQLKLVKFLEDETQAECAFLLLVVPETQELFCQVIGKKVLPDEIRFPGSSSSFSVALETKQPIGLDDIPMENRKGIEEILEQPLNSLLCVPVKSRSDDNLIAIACVVNKKNGSRFTDADVSCIQQCLRYTSTVLTSTLAFQNERKLKIQTQAMLQVARHLFTNLGELISSRSYGMENFPLIRSRECEVDLYGRTEAESPEITFGSLCSKHCIIKEEYLSANTNSCLYCLKHLSNINLDQNVRQAADVTSGGSNQQQSQDTACFASRGSGFKLNPILKSPDKQRKAFKDNLRASPYDIKERKGMVKTETSAMELRKESSGDSRVLMGADGHTISLQGSSSIDTFTDNHGEGLMIDFHMDNFSRPRFENESPYCDATDDEDFYGDADDKEEFVSHARSPSVSPKRGVGADESALQKRSLSRESYLSSNDSFTTAVASSSAEDLSDQEFFNDIAGSYIISDETDSCTLCDSLNDITDDYFNESKTEKIELSSGGNSYDKSSLRETPPGVETVPDRDDGGTSVDVGFSIGDASSYLNSFKSFLFNKIPTEVKACGSFCVTVEDFETGFVHKLSSQAFDKTESKSSLYCLPRQGCSDSMCDCRSQPAGYSDTTLNMAKWQAPITEVSPIEESDLTKLLREIMQQARNLSQAERCSVFLIDKETDELVAEVFDGITPKDNEVSHNSDQAEIRMPISQGIAGHVATTGELLNIKDAYSHPLFYRGIDDSTGFRTRNILCFPIKDEKGVVLGVAQLCNKKTGPCFTIFDEEISTAFGIYCCISISHSLMYKKVIDSQVRSTLANELMMYHMEGLMYKRLQDSQHRKSLANELMIYHMQVNNDDVSTLTHSEIPSPRLVHNCFDTFTYIPRSLPENNTALVCLSMFEDLGFISRWRIRRDTLARFMLMVKKGYRNPPYHNWMHAYTVAHFCFLLTKNLHLEKHLDEIELFTLFVACLCHDIDHRGTNNTFQVASKSVLAALYSSEGSVLERHHFAQTMCILNTEGCNIYENLSSKEYQQALDLTREIILATDLAHHLKIMNNLKEMAKVGYNKTNPRNHKLLMCLLMTACDLSDQTKPWENTKHVAALIYKEFFSQGDLEKAQGKEPIEMMDRERAQIPALQIGFLDHVAFPVYKLLADMFPEAAPVASAVQDNCNHWEKIAQLIKMRRGGSSARMTFDEVLAIETEADQDDPQQKQQQQTVDYSKQNGNE